MNESNRVSLDSETHSRLLQRDLRHAHSSEHSHQPAYFDTSICHSEYFLSTTLSSIPTTPDQAVCEVTDIFILSQLWAGNSSDSHPGILVMNLVSSHVQLLCRGQTQFFPLRSFPWSLLYLILFAYGFQNHICKHDIFSFSESMFFFLALRRRAPFTGLWSHRGVNDNNFIIKFRIFIVQITQLVLLFI